MFVYIYLYMCVLTHEMWIMRLKLAKALVKLAKFEIIDKILIVRSDFNKIYCLREVSKIIV